MKFCIENWEDIRKYFLNSYMKFPSIGDEVVYVTAVGPKSMKGNQLARDDSEAWEFTFCPDGSAVEIEFILPRKSYFEYEGRCYFLYRIPARQYSRGINKENTAIVELTHDGFGGRNIDLQLINAYASKPSFHGFKNTGEGTNYPVTPRMAVDATGILFIDRVRIGSVDYRNKIISCNKELFVSEIQAVLREYGQWDWKVTQPITKSTNKSKAMSEIEAYKQMVQEGVV